MQSFTKFTLRYAIYLVVVAYLLGDLFLFNGPLNRRIRAADPNSPEAIAAAKASGVVARVFNHEITRRQLDRAVHEYLWKRGKDPADLRPSDQKLVELAALGELIDHNLLRVKANANAADLPVSEREINRRLERFTTGFNSAAQLTDAMKSQGIPHETDLRNRIAALIQQEKYLAMRVDPLTEVTNEEIPEFYQENLSSLRVPERIRARHVFIATLGTPPEEAETKLRRALSRLTLGETDFPTLAKTLSTDPATKNRGGDLGWMSANRLPDDFTKAVFSLAKNNPTLIRTRIGWHIVEVTDRKAAQTPPLADIRDEIETALRNRKRHIATRDFRNALRSFEDSKIQIFHDQLRR